MRVARLDAPARQGSLRRHNLGLVLRELAVAGPLARAELARRTGLTKATISAYVEALQAAGIVEEAPGDAVAVPSRGRPASPVRLGPGAPVAVGVELGVDFVSACVTAPTGEVVGMLRTPRDQRSGDPRDRLAEAADDVASLVASLALGAGRVVGLGLAFPGVVGPDGRIRSAPNLPGWNGLDVGRGLAAHLGRLGGGERLVVETGNEADLAALGELWFGEHPELADFALVSAEVGVGAGIVVGGRLFTGATGAAGELGHLTVDPDGPACGCGSKGCLERYAGLVALLEGSGTAEVGGLRAAADRGEPRAVSVLARAGTALGVAAAALVNLLDVPVLVLGGIYAELAPHLAGPLAAELQIRAVRHLWDPVRLVTARLGAEAAVRGAAGLVHDRVLDDPATYLPEVLG